MNKTKLIITALSAAFSVQAYADTVNLTPANTGTVIKSSGDDYSITIGHSATTNGQEGTGVVIGMNANTKTAGATKGGVAIGANASIDTTSDPLSNSYNAVAVGEAARVEAQGGTSVGGAAFSKYDATAVGTLSEAHSQRSTAVGTYATVLSGADNSTALGFRSSVAADDAKGGTGRFTGKEVTDSNGVVSVGQSAAATTELGSNATYNKVNGQTSSIYQTTFNRRIINVDDGVNDTDAVNVRQVEKAVEIVQKDLVGQIDTAKNTLQTQIDTLNTTTGNLSSSVSNLNTGLGNLTTRTDNLDNSVTKLTTDVSNLNTGVSNLTTNVTNLTTNVTNLTTDVTNLNTNVTNLTAGLGNLNTRMGNLDSRVDNLDARVDDLDARLDDVSRRAQDGAALALATAGLVSPPEGKNGFVVGTGHFRGSNALAVGYAYTGSSWGVKATASAAGRKNFGVTLSSGIFW